MAIPQTSACATNSCDDADYSGKDLRAEYYTKARRARRTRASSSFLTPDWCCHPAAGLAEARQVHEEQPAGCDAVRG